MKSLSVLGVFGHKNVSTPIGKEQVSMITISTNSFITTSFLFKYNRANSPTIISRKFVYYDSFLTYLKNYKKLLLLTLAANNFHAHAGMLVPLNRVKLNKPGYDRLIQI